MLEGDDMYARTSTWAGTPEAFDSWVRHVKGCPDGCRLRDNGGAYFFCRQRPGPCPHAHAWTSEGAALRIDETADKSRDSTIAATGVELLKSMALLIGPSSRKHLGVW
jgi:hypothetical protein